MTRGKQIPDLTIKETLALGHQDWHAQDYFISADEPLQPGRGLFRPDFYALFICISGGLTVNVNGQQTELRPFCFMAASPRTVIEVTKVLAGSKGRYLFFTQDFLLRNIINPSLLDAFYYLSEQVGCCLQLTEAEASVLLQLYAILEGKRGEETAIYHVEIIRSLFFTFLYEAAAVYKLKMPRQLTRHRRDQDIHQRFSELLIIHDRHEHHLKFYADKLFITPQHLIHAIRNACGKTPGALIDEAIIAEAKLLLHDATRSIGTVALELHFSGTPAFSKFFKKHTGNSPAQYRADNK